MTGKIYAYLGRNAASISFPTSTTDGAKGGSLRQLGAVPLCRYVPAHRKNFSLAKSNVITDPVYQQIIERSSFFGKTVVISDIINYDEDEGKKKVKVYEEVTNFAEACQILKNEYGIKAQQLKSPAGARQLAKAYNVEFPNWK